MSTHLYDEAQIVALVTEYYHLLDSLCYSSVDEIEFPPSKGRDVDESLCHELNLPVAVVSLMRYLPCPCAEGIMLEHELFLPRSHANSFVENNLIKLGRDPESGENLWFLAPAHIALSIMGDEGRYLVLDTAKNTLRVCEWEPPVTPQDNEDQSARYDFDPASPSDHYTRFPIHDPIEFLQSTIKNVRNLEWLPRRLYGVGTISNDDPGYTRTKIILINEYGWPDNFKSDEWKRDCERVLHENL